MRRKIEENRIKGYSTVTVIYFSSATEMKLNLRHVQRYVPHNHCFHSKRDRMKGNRLNTHIGLILKLISLDVFLDQSRLQKPRKSLEVADFVPRAFPLEIPKSPGNEVEGVANIVTRISHIF